jgi:hypothetical protein
VTRVPHTGASRGRTVRDPAVQENYLVGVLDVIAERLAGAPVSRGRPRRIDNRATPDPQVVPQNTSFDPSAPEAESGRSGPSARFQEPVEPYDLRD